MFLSDQFMQIDFLLAYSLPFACPEYKTLCTVLQFYCCFQRDVLWDVTAPVEVQWKMSFYDRSLLIPFIYLCFFWFFFPYSFSFSVYISEYVLKENLFLVVIE